MSYTDKAKIAYDPKQLGKNLRHEAVVTRIKTCGKCGRPTYERHADGRHGCLSAACKFKEAE